MIHFGTGGFRGVIGDDFTRENVQLCAQGLSNIVLADHSKQPIIIGFDNRFMSDFAARWFAEVLAGNGIRVYLFLSPVPTPCVMSATRDMHHDYGVMVTASHNPFYFNGIKLFLSQGFDADVAFTNRLEKVVSEVKEVKTMSLPEAKKLWLIQDFTNTNIYLTHIKRFISPKIHNNHAKIIYDNMCGVGVVGLEPLAKELGIHQFDIVHAEHDAFFSFNLPNPTEAMLSGDFRDKVLSGHYDCGLATDSDGDRLGIIDEKGNYVSNNEILASLYYYLVKYKDMKGDIVKNCATSILVDKVAAKLGFKCHEVDVGFKNITAKMKEVDALIGGESSGGLTVRGYLFGKDSVFSSALFMEMMILLNKPVSEIIADVKKFADYHYSFLEDSLIYTTESEPLIAYIDQHPPVFSRPLVRYEHFTRNFKFYFDNDCWMLIRLSGTEPTFRIFAEMENDQEAVKCVRELKDYLEQVEMIIGGK